METEEEWIAGREEGSWEGGEGYLGWGGREWRGNCGRCVKQMKKMLFKESLKIKERERERNKKDTEREVPQFQEGDGHKGEVIV